MRSLFYFSLILSALTAQPQISIVVSSQKLVEGETVDFEVQVKNGGSLEKVGIEVLTKQFKIVSGPRSSRNVQIINGVVTSTNSLTWSLLPLVTGTIQIPSLKVSVDGKIYDTQPLTIEIISATSSGTPPLDKQTVPIFLDVSADKDTVYRGEQVTVTWSLYTQVDIASWEITSNPALTGFWGEELYAPTQLQLRERIMDGRRYYTAVVKKMALFPAMSGLLTVDPMVVKCGVQIRSSKRRRDVFDPFMDDFFFNRGRVETRLLSSTPLKVAVMPLPTAGRPAAFGGLVGRFKVEGHLDQDQTRRDAAVTLTFRLNGDGNFKALTFPEIRFPEGLEVFDPKTTESESSLSDIVGGTKEVEYVIIPRRAGVFAIPQMEVHYFNPASGNYELTAAGPFRLEVLPGDESIVASQGFSRREVALLGEDIRFLKSGDPRWHKTGEGWYTSSIFLLNLATLLVFVAPWVGQKTRLFVTTDQPGRRSRRALKVALVKVTTTTGSHEQVYGAFSRAISTYLNDKLQRNTGEYTMSEIEELLSAQGADREVINAVVYIMEQSAAARFAPEESLDVEADRKMLTDTLQRLEDRWL